ncbi:MAG: glycoside hydrolase family 28 protein [Leadbetterella sp.]
MIKYVCILCMITHWVSGQNFYLPIKTDKTGKTLVTVQIQTVLDKIAKQGGGTLYISTGNYLTGSLFPGKNTTILLENGAQLIASKSMKDYVGKHFIHAKNADNFTLKGEGTINGNGSFFYDSTYKPLARPEPWIVIENSKQVHVEGIKFINSPSHVLVLDNCRKVNIHRISIICDPKSPNTDGIDIVGSSDVVIDQCYFETGDDAICLKSKKDMDNAFAKEGSSSGIENVIVTNCILKSDDAAIKLGTGSEYVTKNCLFKNNIVSDSRYGVALFMMDGGSYENIVFSDMIIETGGRHDNHYPIFLDIHQRNENSKVGQIKGITFKDISIKTEGCVYISGHKDSFVDNILFDNIQIDIPFARNTDKWVKPKGNKAIKQWATCADFTKEKASFIIGNAKNVQLKDVRISHTKSDVQKHAFGFINATVQTDHISGNSIGVDTLYFETNSHVQKIQE